MLHRAPSGPFLHGSPPAGSTLDHTYQPVQPQPYLHSHPHFEGLSRPLDVPTVKIEADRNKVTPHHGGHIYIRPSHPVIIPTPVIGTNGNTIEAVTNGSHNGKH